MSAKRTRLRKIEASELKKNCVAILREIEQTGNHIIITKNGNPVAELVPHNPNKPRGILKGQMEIVGDIISPIDFEWEALK
jgi:prevent-host-death family protein